MGAAGRPAPSGERPQHRFDAVSERDFARDLRQVACGLGRDYLKDAASLARTRELDGSSIHVCYRLTGMGWGEGSGVPARYLKRDASVNSEILGRLVIAKNGVELRSPVVKI